MLAVRPYTSTYWDRPLSNPTPAIEPAKPSGLWDWYKSLKEPQPPSPLESAVAGLRHNAEGAAVGAILGFVDGEFGGLDLGGVYPVDAITAAILYFASIRDAGKAEGFASDLRAISQSCLTTFAYRKTKQWREDQKAIVKSGSVDIPRNSRPKSVDRIIQAGKAAGL
jgi:hypothetical protein